MTINALAHLRKGDKTLPMLMIAGDGPDRAGLEALTLKLGLVDNVKFIGWTDDITGFWEAQHVSVAPAHKFTESFCMTAVEAMAHGRPSIVSNRGALPELMLPDITGSIVQAGDASALADAIATYISMPRLAVEQGAAAHAHAQQCYTLERCANDYVALAKDIMIENQQ